MKVAVLVVSLLSIFEATLGYAPQTPKKPAFDLKNAAAGAFAAFTIASSVIAAPPAANAIHPPAFSSSSTILAEKVIRQGLYREYEVDITEQVDDARSTFKPKEETKSKKGKYTALLAVLIVGSFVIPMAQYFWYVRDDDSADKFFAEKVPEPKKEPKKKGWF